MQVYQTLLSINLSIDRVIKLNNSRLLFVNIWREAIGINLFSIQMSFVVASPEFHVSLLDEDPPEQIKPLSTFHDWSQPS